MFLKNAAEIERVVVSDNVSDLSHVVIRRLEEHLRVGDAYGHDVLHGRCVGALFEIPDKPAHAHAPRRGVLFDIDFRVVMVVKILYGRFHLRVQIDILDSFFRGDLAVDRDEKLPQQQCQHLLVVGLAALQF